MKNSNNIPATPFNAYDIAASLYDGCWRAEDRTDIIAEYDFSEAEATAICEELAYIASKQS